ncbi:poly(U)-specific endoribonuclease-B-like isoform X2 [Neltuma alba]|uniref:poly(U)-specific endoribonuclease-B-like isoform X2 n=1 Tax=Neltuma alba TaxID=207710 RepID=UPI0010A30C72|nr:poly(U)-specific endoribonuclease-B-like isoform X2 [Prosopis alba]
MEDLIKGLAGAVLDRLGNDEEPNSQSRDERSRSTWAEVVSGDQDNDEGRGDRRHGYRGNNWNKEEQSRLEQERQADRSRLSTRPHKEQYRPEQENWQEDIYKTSYKPHKEQYSPQQEEWEAENCNPSSRPQKDEENDDGWETVGKKPPRKSHKIIKDHWGGYKAPAEEQEYSNDVEIGAALEPSKDELADFSQACSKLWDLDLNRLVPGKDYEIDCGEGKRVSQNEDMAQGNLFTWVSDDVFRKPTFARFCSLLDNYNPQQGYKEVVTSEERQEQAAFIEEISRTAPIKYLHKYLVSKGIASGSYQDFKRLISSLWFELYSRGGTSGSSSAFEHVFVGEIKQNGEVSGFHNWLQFYLEEAKGRVDYQGYIFPRRRGEIPDSESQLLTIQFEWNGVLKSLSSTLVGVSPEFELALYTLCFYVGEEDNHIQLGPYSVNIKCYRFGDHIGSVFPIAE